MDERRPLDHRVRDVSRLERFVGAAIGEEAAFAVRVDERDQPPCLAIRIADEMRRNADRLEARRLAFDVGGADARDEIDARAVAGEPRGLIGGRAAGLNRNRRAPVRAARDRPFRPHNDVRHHVADDEGARSAQNHLDTRVGESPSETAMLPKAELLVAKCGGKKN